MVKPEKFKATLVQKIERAPEVFELFVKTEKALEHTPGQFYAISIPHEGKLPMSRAYSICSLSNEGHLQFIIKLLDGPGSKYIEKVKEQEEMEINGPFGLFFHNSNAEATDDVCVCTGTGVAPFLAFAKQHTIDTNQGKETKPLKLLFGLRTANDIYFKEELDELQAKNPKFTYHICLSRDEAPDTLKGRVTENLEEHISPTSQVYICGNPEMVDQVNEILQSKGHSKDYISFEKY